MKKWLVSAALALSVAAHAAVVVNVPGATGGAGTVSPVSYPVAAGTVLDVFNPVLLDLAAGDYVITPTAAGLTPGAQYTAWNFQANAPGSWGNHFVAGRMLSGSRLSVLLDVTTTLEPTCKNHFCAYDTEAQAIEAWLATPVFKFSLQSAATVGFVSADYYLPDNLGGISFILSSAAAIPEPPAALLLLSGLMLVGCAAARSTRSKRRDLDGAPHIRADEAHA